MSLRSWVSIITLAFLGLIVYGARHEITQAWNLLDQVNLAILSLLVPFQIISYFMAGEMVFGNLRAKRGIDHISPLSQARMALEMNFVNHALPSAGVSGMSYMTWRMHRYGISPGRSTLAQIIRYFMSFAAFVTMLLSALVVITLDGHINRWIILLSIGLIMAMLVAVIGGVYLIAKPSRYQAFSRWAKRVFDRLTKIVTFGKRRSLIKDGVIENFFDDIHKDFLSVRNEKRLLWAPYWWGIGLRFSKFCCL